MSHMGIAYLVEHNAQGTLLHHGFSLLINVECACVLINVEWALSLSVLYSVSCLEDIRFQIERLLMDQSQKSLVHQSKILDFCAATQSNIMNLKKFTIALIWRLLVGCTVNTVQIHQLIRFTSAKVCCWVVNVFNLSNFHW